MVTPRSLTYHIKLNFIHQMIFDTVDVDGDGHINIEEYGYAVLSFYFQSGPESVLSQLFGPLVPEETKQEDLCNLSEICRR